MPSLVRRAALALAAAALLVPAAGQAQRAPASSLVQLAPYAGYMLFGGIFDGPLGTSLANANGAIYGAQVAVQLLPGLSIVGNVARADASLQVGIPFLGGYDIGESSVLLYDAGLQLGASLGDRTRLPLAPFVQAGIGGMRHDVRSGVLRTDATNLAFNAGVGADVALSRGLGLRVMAKDYMGRFDSEEATGLGAEAKFAHNWALSGGVALSF
jgi:hypothetical protein